MQEILDIEKEAVDLNSEIGVYEGFEEGKIRANADWVIGVRTTKTDYEEGAGGEKRYKVGKIYIPDYVGDMSYMIKVIDVGPKCKTIDHSLVGSIAQCDEEDLHPDIRRIIGEIWAVREGKIPFVLT